MVSFGQRILNIIFIILYSFFFYVVCPILVYFFVRLLVRLWHFLDRLFISYDLDFHLAWLLSFCICFFIVVSLYYTICELFRSNDSDDLDDSNPL